MKHFFTFLLCLFLLSSSSQTWANGKPNQNVRQALDTSFVITPTISTKDTLYLKYEDANVSTTTWWERYGCQAILLTIIGAGITLFTTWLTNKQERKHRELDRIKEQATETEKKIYNLIVALRNAADDKREDAIQQLSAELQGAELTMRTPLYLTASQLLTLYQNGEGLNSLNLMSEERNLLKQYKKQFFGRD